LIKPFMTAAPQLIGYAARASAAERTCRLENRRDGVFEATNTRVEEHAQ
jgi:hypothetical protein